MPISASANRLKREIEQGKTKSLPPTEEQLKKDPKFKNPKTQFEILEQIGITAEDVPKFCDPNYWLQFFPPKGVDDLKLLGINVDWRRSFITTSVNPYYDSFIRW